VVLAVEDDSFTMNGANEQKKPTGGSKSSKANKNDNNKKVGSRLGYTTLGIMIGVTMSSVHTMIGLARSTRVTVDYHDNAMNALPGPSHLLDLSSKHVREPVETEVDFFQINKLMAFRENHYSGLWWANVESTSSCLAQKERDGAKWAF